MRVVFSPMASDDLLAIAEYIAQDNVSRALSFVDELEAKCIGLGLAPGIGTQCPGLGAGVTMFPFRRYLIFYRQVRQTEGDEALRIERVLHGARLIDDGDFL